ncbi:hypothetical protein [Nocardioides sp.]|uniref:hypothetical protein n=1 Tax=Nocardioides sp. TaxID=35761 RepID=UPI002EDB8BDE
MTGTIETEVRGDPAAFRALGDYLRTVLAARTTDLADRTAAERSSLAGSWQGAAADAFGGRAATLVTAGDGVAEQARAAAAEVEALGEALCLAQDGMAQVRASAAAGGLHVEGTVIMWPPDAWRLDLLETTRLQEAWNAALAGERRHRQAWYTALDRAAAFAEFSSSTLLGLTADLVVTAAERALLLVTARGLMGRAEFYASEVRRLDGQIDDLARAFDRFGRPGDRLLLDQLVDERIEKRYAAQALHDAAEHPELPRELRGGFGVLSGALAGYGVYSDIQAGESTKQAVVSQGAGFAAGVVGAAGLGAVAGSWAPGPGTAIGAVTVGGAAFVGGALGSVLGDKGVDHFLFGHDEPGDDEAEEPEPGAELLDYAAEVLSSPQDAGHREAP